MTEDEAKTKWCPFARENDEDSGAYNRVVFPIRRADKSVEIDEKGRWKMNPPEPSSGCFCLGSQCMAWRELFSSPHGNIVEAIKTLSGKDVNLEDVIDKKKLTEVRGYCGLAGKP